MWILVGVAKNRLKVIWLENMFPSRQKFENWERAWIIPKRTNMLLFSQTFRGSNFIPLITLGGTELMRHTFTWYSCVDNIRMVGKLHWITYVSNLECFFFKGQPKMFIYMPWPKFVKNTFLCGKLVQYLAIKIWLPNFLVEICFLDASGDCKKTRFLVSHLFVKTLSSFRISFFERLYDASAFWIWHAVFFFFFFFFFFFLIPFLARTRSSHFWSPRF